jgi:hypothetical protein
MFVAVINVVESEDVWAVCDSRNVVMSEDVRVFDVINEDT